MNSEYKYFYPFNFFRSNSIALILLRGRTIIVGQHSKLVLNSFQVILSLTKSLPSVTIDTSTQVGKQFTACTGLTLHRWDVAELRNYFEMCTWQKRIVNHLLCILCSIHVNFARIMLIARSQISPRFGLLISLLHYCYTLSVLR